MPNKIDLLMGDDTACLASSVLFNLSHVQFNGEDEVVAMLSITAPEIDVENARTPLNLVAAIDISTSMQGAKLRTAKASLAKLVEHLGPDDRLSIISFGSDVRTVFNSDFMTGPNKTVALTAVKQLAVSGWTNFSGAMMESFATMNKYEGKGGAINRIILFTDGEPTSGVTDEGQLLDIFDKALNENISVSTFGYGKSYNAELLSEMSKRGGGSHYAVSDIEQCAAMFGTELGGLLTTYAQNIRVALNLAEGVTFNGFMDTAYEIDGQEITLPDILGGETKNVLVKLKLPKKTRAVCARESKVLDFRIEYDDLQEARRKDDSVPARIQYVRRKDDVSSETNLEVQGQIDLLEAAAAIKNAQRMADAGDLAGARESLLNLSRDYSSVGRRESFYSPQLSTDMLEMAEGMESNRGYSATRSRLVASSMAYSTRRATGTLNDAMFTNAGQESVAAAFTAPVTPAPTVPPSSSSSTD